MLLDEIETTKEVKTPQDPIKRIIGQGNAVEKVRLAIRQRRHLLLVGPPGIGKSMLAKAISYHLEKPKQQISVLHNPQRPHHPVVEVLSREEIEAESRKVGVYLGRTASPQELPYFVAERLGYRCSYCGVTSKPDDIICPKCGSNKYGKVKTKSPVGNAITEVFELGINTPEREVYATRINSAGKEETVVYQRLDKDRVRVLDQKSIEELRAINEGKKRNVIVPLSRRNFVHATGASETELLGDVRHDPYGSHPEIGTPAYLRVVPGAVHEAHEGVLFVDELPHLEHLQNFILTAMQERRFPITGRNPQSGGASIKVEDVPCDFLFVGACNIKDVQSILPPLRSRILGNGYEILLDSTMPDTLENRDSLLQFVAQEIVIDGRIPQATREVVLELVEEAKRRARTMDNEKNALTLRLRDLGGVIRLAGDYAILEDAKFIEKRHLERSIRESKSIEHQLKERYGSILEGMRKDNALDLDVGTEGNGYR